MSLIKNSRRAAIVLAVWFPFFVSWILIILTYTRSSVWDATFFAALAIGSAAFLGIGVWHFCRLYPWPAALNARFYLVHVFAAMVYSSIWSFWLYVTQALTTSRPVWEQIASSRVLLWQLLMGVWLYGLVAGVCYAIEIRSTLTVKERAAQRAEAAAISARLDALRARLHPHFLFNALHTVSALIRFDPAAAQDAVQRLGDLLRYALREGEMDLVEFGEEIHFVQQYLDFEQLRFADRLKVQVNTEPECFHWEVPTFAVQTLVENAVQHSLSIRPSGGSISISASVAKGFLRIAVWDDGPACIKAQHNSSQFGLKALRERLEGLYGSLAELRTDQGEDGFTVTILLPETKRTSSIK